MKDVCFCSDDLCLCMGTISCLCLDDECNRARCWDRIRMLHNTSIGDRGSFPFVDSLPEVTVDQFEKMQTLERKIMETKKQYIYSITLENGQTFMYKFDGMYFHHKDEEGLETKSLITSATFVEPVDEEVAPVELTPLEVESVEQL